jgi:transcriptional regulator with XRE-family HTH domain
MSLFFDAAWFDARLAERGLDRGALAASAGLDRGELHQLFTNERSPTARELDAFAALLGADIVETTLRAGVAARAPYDDTAAPSARIEDIEARLNAIDDWIEAFERARKRA